jgi:hypothetical protein
VRFVKCSVDEADAARLAADERLRAVLQSIASIYSE